MRTKIIRGILERKVIDWMNSIEDHELAELVAPHVVITGGCITSMLLDEKVSDYDVYISNFEALRALTAYYVKQFCKNPPPKFGSGGCVSIGIKEENLRIKIVVKSAGVAGEAKTDGYEYFEAQPQEAAGQYLDAVIRDTEDVGTPDSDNKMYTDLVKDVAEDLVPSKGKAKYRPVFLTSNAITLSDGLQLCIRFWGTPEEIHKNFDFVHCTNFYAHNTKRLDLNSAALESIVTRDLRYIGSLYPVCSVIRTRKFVKRGWHCNAGQFVKMAFQISDLDLTNVNVLEDQLTGVDTAYFQQLITMIREDAEKNNVKIDQTYIVELIDRLF